MTSLTKLGGHWREISEGNWVKVAGHWESAEEWEKINSSWSLAGSGMPPPVFTGAITTITTIAGKPFTKDISQRFYGNQVDSYTLENAPAGMTISNAGVISWPVPTRIGDTAITVVAHNMTGDARSNSIRLTVLFKPVFTGTIGNINTSEGKRIFIDISSYFTDTRTYTLENAPSGMTITIVDGVPYILWPNAISIGIFHFTVVGHSVVWTARSNSIQLTVGTATTAPVITTQPAFVVPLDGSAFTFDISSSFNPRGTSYSLQNAPAGMAISNDGVITWPHPTHVTISYTRVTATNSHGSVKTNPLSVTYTSAAVVVSAIAPRTIVPNILLRYQVSSHFAFATSYSLHTAPDGMLIDNSGVITWPNPISGDHWVEVTAHGTLGDVTSQAFKIRVTALVVLISTIPDMSENLGEAFSENISSHFFNADSYTMEPVVPSVTISNAGIISGVLTASTLVRVIGHNMFGPVKSNQFNITGVVGLPVLLGSALHSLTMPAGTPYELDISNWFSGYRITYTLKGAPSGMVISAAGVITWPNPVPVSIRYMHIRAANTAGSISTRSMSIAVKIG